MGEQVFGVPVKKINDGANAMFAGQGGPKPPQALSLSVVGMKRGGKVSRKAHHLRISAFLEDSFLQTLCNDIRLFWECLCVFDVFIFGPLSTSPIEEIGAARLPKL